MLKPGEKVVAVTNFRDFVLVFGDEGTVLRMEYDPTTAEFYTFMKVIDLRYGQ